MMNKLIWLGILQIVSSLPVENEYNNEPNTTDPILTKAQTSTQNVSSTILNDVKNRILESSTYNPVTGKFSLNSSIGNSTTGYIIGDNNKRYRVKLKKKVTGDLNNRQESENTTQRIIINGTTTSRTSLRSETRTSRNQTENAQISPESSVIGENIKTDSNIVNIKNESIISIARSGGQENNNLLKYKKDEKGRFVGGFKEVKPKQKFRVTTHRTTTTTLRKPSTEEKNNEIKAESDREEKEYDENIISNICQILKVKPGDVQLLAKKYFGLNLNEPEDLENFRRLYDEFIEKLKDSPDLDGVNITKLVDLIALDSQNGQNAIGDRTGLDVSADPNVLNKTQSLVANLTNFLKPLLSLSANETNSNIFDHINITVIREHKDNMEREGVEEETAISHLITTTESSYAIEPTEIPQVESSLNSYPTQITDIRKPSQKASDLNFLPKFIERLATPDDDQSHNSVKILIFRNQPNLQNITTEVHSNIADDVELENPLNELPSDRLGFSEETDNITVIIENNYNNMIKQAVNKSNNAPFSISVIGNSKSANAQGNPKESHVKYIKVDPSLKVLSKNIMNEYPIEREAVGFKYTPNETIERSTIPEDLFDSTQYTFDGNLGSKESESSQEKPEYNAFYENSKTAQPEDDNEDNLPPINFKLVQDKPKITTVTTDDAHHLVNENELNPKELTTELNNINDQLTPYPNGNGKNREIVLKTMLNYQIPIIVQQLKQNNPRLNEEQMTKDLFLKFITKYPEYGQPILGNVNYLDSDDVGKNIAEDKLLSRDAAIILKQPQKPNNVKIVIPIPKNIHTDVRKPLQNNSSSTSNDYINIVQSYSNMHPVIEKLLDKISQKPNKNSDVIVKWKETLGPTLYKTSGEPDKPFENVLDFPILREDDFNFNQLIYHEVPKLIYQMKELNPELDTNDIIEELLFALSTLYPQLPSHLANKFSEPELRPSEYESPNIPVIKLIRKILLKPEFEVSFKIPKHIKRKIIKSIDDHLKSIHNFFENQSEEAEPIIAKDNIYTDPDLPISEDIQALQFKPVLGPKFTLSKKKYPKNKLIWRPWLSLDLKEAGPSPKDTSKSLFVSPQFVPYFTTEHLPYQIGLYNNPLKPTKPSLNPSFSKSHRYLIYDENMPYNQSPLLERNSDITAKFRYLQKYYPQIYESLLSHNPEDLDYANKIIASFNLIPLFEDESKRHMPFGITPYPKLDQQQDAKIDQQQLEPYWIPLSSNEETLSRIPDDSISDEVATTSADLDINLINNYLGPDDPKDNFLPPLQLNDEYSQEYNNNGINGIKKLDSKHIISVDPHTQYKVKMPKVNNKVNYYDSTTIPELDIEFGNLRSDAAEKQVESILDIPTPSFHQHYQEYALNIMNTTLAKLRLVLEQNKVPHNRIEDLINDIRVVMIVEIENPKGDCPNVQITNFIKTLKIKIKAHLSKAGLSNIK